MGETVYLVTIGEYSDRGVQGVFTSREKAAEVVGVLGVLFPDRETEIEEVILDDVRMTNHVYATVYDDGQVMFENVEEGEERVSRYPGTHYTFVRVNYNPRREVMIKAAIDRAAMLIARKVGA